MATSRGITETKMYDHEAVVERYGIAPELIPDFYGLKGDTSDNIPGVPGIGDKTASQLLQQCGDLEGVLAHIDDISGAKRKQNLTEHADDARVSKQLATIRRDVPIEVDPAAEAAREPDRSRLRDVFREFELRDPLRAWRRCSATTRPRPRRAETTLGARCARARSSTSPRSAVDAELAVAVARAGAARGRAVRRRRPWRFGVASRRARPHRRRGRPEAVVAALGDRPVIAHDAKTLRVVPPNARPRHAARRLPARARAARLPVPRDLRGARPGRRRRGPGRAPTPCSSLALAAWQREQLADRGLTRLMDEVELPLARVLRDMEIAGVRLDKERLAEVDGRVREEITQLEREIWELAGTEFVIGSPQQLGAVLFEKLGLSRKRRGKTGFSTDARVLQAIRDEHEIVPKIERWRELNQIEKTYLDVLPQLADAESRIHTTFLQAGATTGRLASTNPNMQNVPVRTELGREIRGCFEAAPGNVLTSADYSQVELRVLAHIADEPVLKEIFVRGEDVHTATAAQVFDKDPSALTPMDRSKAKMINYGIVYGLSDYGLADRLNIAREEAKAFIDAYLERFSRVAAFMTRTIEEATEHGHVTTLYGRRRQIPELRARNWGVRTLGERLAVNTVIQGTAADVMKLAMIRVHAELGRRALRTRLILTIHDELLLEGPPEEAEEVATLVDREMVAPWEDRAPPLAVDVGIGPTWLAAK